MKRKTLVGTIAAALAVGGIGVGTAIAVSPDPTPEATPAVSASADATPTPEPTPEPTTSTVLTAQEPSMERNEETFLVFVRGRLATFPSQIPNATDADLITTGDVACELIADAQAQGQRAVDVVDGLSLIQGEKPSEIGGYYYDSNAIIAGAQLHLCPETID